MSQLLPHAAAELFRPRTTTGRAQRVGGCALRAPAPAMQWNDDDDEVVCVVAKKETEGCKKEKELCSVADTEVHPLHLLTPKEKASHKTECKNKRCLCCKAANYLNKHQAGFQIVTEEQMGSAQYSKLNDKQKTLANSMWLNHGYRGDEVVLGCCVCHSLQDNRMMTNPFASYRYPASRLLEPSGRPHVLMRHAKTEVHCKAVAKFLDMDGAQGKPLFILRRTCC